MNTGVYLIRNIINSKGYVGSTTDSFQARFSGHRSQLRRGCHHSNKLQRAWDKYGEQNFIFEVLVRCEPEWCIFQEQGAITFHHSEYNILSIASRSGPKSQEFRQDISKRMLGNTIWVGRKHSMETRAKMSIAAKGRNGPSGERNGNARLTIIQVKEIYTRRHSGERRVDLAQEFGVTPATITRISKGHSKWQIF